MSLPNFLSTFFLLFCIYDRYSLEEAERHENTQKAPNRDRSSNGLMVIISPDTEGCAIVTQQEITPNQTSLLKLTSDNILFPQELLSFFLILMFDLCSFTLHTI